MVLRTWVFSTCKYCLGYLSLVFSSYQLAAGPYSSGTFAACLTSNVEWFPVSNCEPSSCPDMASAGGDSKSKRRSLQDFGDVRDLDVTCSNLCEE